MQGRGDRDGCEQGSVVMNGVVGGQAPEAARCCGCGAAAGLYGWYYVLFDELRLGFRWAKSEVQQINNLSEVRPGRGRDGLAG